MNPVNATSLYVSACRSLLQCDPKDSESYEGLFNVLPFFRDSLSCLVCGNLLQEPLAPKDSSCQHCVCKACKGKKMLLKPSCSWCKDYEQFEENKQLQILIDCYRSLCECVSVCVMTEQSALGVKGYTEVKKMLEEVLGVKQEQEEFSSVKDAAYVPHLKIETDSENSADIKPSEQIPAELEAPEPVSADKPLRSNSELLMNSVTVNAVKCKVSQDESAESLHLSAENIRILEDLESDIASKGVSCELTESVAELCQHSQTSDALTPGQPQTCLAAAHRKVRLSRKRSRSESDREMLQPLPITSLIQGPSVAATAPSKTASELKAPSPPVVVVTNGCVLKVNKAVLDSTKNIQINTDLANKKVQVKSKVAVPKAKGKPKDRLLSASVLPGQPPKVVYKKTQEKKGCKCGRATQNPSVLTCRGQRCPCYSNRKACLDCICRGCQNSYMANGEKKLEAFAVPEKALEQTRLTLGINLTSISVRNTGTNAAGVLSLSAGSPMASFLTSSADEDQSFEDALEMHFDC
ncbi:E3 ubiquitin-protein ligase MSL2a [Pimephales promelas]|uniref:E3 ubiquitin-protein ligase MSL2a n=1 Tax=Pimephales promelas TaxID=90988 RepID=UPI001955F0D4|nr:E3 ubiquitin-protein ligase MSL2a [Pimephales promelas]KAG1969635.1 E3 ubiquitin-protein ligase MSL2 [Pimephales promelas]KAG1969636.1 E3 ubiquitin-protein ligase MSL2 [Pimephales promelas]